MPSTNRSLDENRVNTAVRSATNEETPLLDKPAKSPGTCNLANEESSQIDNHPSSRSESSSEEAQKANNTNIQGIISILLLGCFIANVDSSIILATYPTISSQTGKGSWLTTTFMLAVCAIQPIYGKFSSLYGVKSTLLTAYTLSLSAPSSAARDKHSSR
ncbi:MAG: hypothetical protein Q9226_008913 [Calogaya cf. arnoldii]